jgi:hypothetical protein
MGRIKAQTKQDSTRITIPHHQSTSRILNYKKKRCFIITLSNYYYHTSTVVTKMVTRYCSTFNTTTAPNLFRQFINLHIISVDQTLVVIKLYNSSCDDWFNLDGCQKPLTLDTDVANQSNSVAVYTSNSIKIVPSIIAFNTITEDQVEEHFSKLLPPAYSKWSRIYRIKIHKKTIAEAIEVLWMQHKGELIEFINY